MAKKTDEDDAWTLSSELNNHPHQIIMESRVDRREEEYPL